jgi:hypothetical protein
LARTAIAWQQDRGFACARPWWLVELPKIRDTGVQYLGARGQKQEGCFEKISGVAGKPDG